MRYVLTTTWQPVRKRLLVLGRGKGKTRSMVDWLLEDRNRRAIVTYNATEAVRIAGAYNLTSDEVMSAERAMRQLKGSKRVVGVDNAEVVLTYLLNCDIEMMTVTS